MKSLALHLITILLLGSLHIIANRHFVLLVATTATTTTASVPTTTQQSPSLRAPPQRTSATTATAASNLVTPLASSTTTTTTEPSITVRRQQQQQQRQRDILTRRSLQAQANSNVELEANSKSNIRTQQSSNTAKTYDSIARLQHNNSTSTSNNKNRTNRNRNSVRQNRSLQSASSAITQHNNNIAANDNNNNSNDSNNQQQKHKRLERRQQLRTSYQKMSTLSTMTTTTPSPLASSSTTRSSHVHSTSSASIFMANRRQSKESSLDDGASDSVEHTATSARNFIKSQQILKSPRMIQRLVAGHIQNAEGHSTYQVSAVSTNSSVSNSTTTLQPATLYFRRKQPMLSSSYSLAKNNTSIKSLQTVNSTGIYLNAANIAEDERDDDAAFLEDSDDFDNWDNGILRLSAGSGKENSIKSKKNKDDSKKTLSDQVRDGKYGLIEKELFRRQPKRPGVLSYLPNKEVPADNEKNFGGLDEEDIWLAEDHLLVIKGGSLNDDEHNEPWPAIDDYDAPGRQIKIPPNPKVPPPFPVQLEENGPVQFIGNNKFTIVFPVANESIPVYPTGPEANYTPPENDSDNEKNLITRPGSAQDSREGGPGYIYPAPYPPWIYHNQTFVNPFLNNARPITFPGLGPFPLGRNGSLENINGTDDFDEDDPSLYYPPAYSFVYKNNYSNPVPPGPLVPGIVLPPPANQFTRLNKHEKGVHSLAPSTPSPPVSPPIRHRPSYTTTSTSTTTTTSTSTTSTTAAPPFRNVITKISEYTPKTIIITPAPPPLTKYPPTPPASPTTSSSPPIEPVPVPVAVPIPIYPSGNYPTTRPNIVSFVPTTPEPNAVTLSKSNPIYYEYFEAKRQPTTSNVIDEFLSTTVKPPTSLRPIKLYANSKRPFKSNHQRNYLQQQQAAPAPNRQFVQENIVYITPKPEIRYKVSPVAPQMPVFKQRPLENFEREVNAIRETLRYYQNQQLRDNSIPRTPKAKPIYEYTFDTTKNLQPAQSITDAGSFQPPAEYDEEPFKPMVTYSPPVDDENAFKAIAYDKVDNDESAAQQQQQQGREELIQPKYQSTTTLVPVQPDPRYQTPQGRPKKQRLRAKYLQQPLIANYQQGQQQQQHQAPLEYQPTSPRTLPTTQPPWVSLNKQEFAEFAQQPRQAERPQLPPPVIGLKNRGFPGYYYGPPPPAPARQNNRFYDEPFQTPIRKIINYRPQSPQQQHQQHHQQQQQQQPNIWSLENDTYVNYAPNRPPLNPDAEFINPYQNIPVNPYINQEQRFPQQQQALPPPPLSHQSQYYAPPQRYPLPASEQRQPHQQIPLHRDILVNYRQPLPPINPDSEYITHPQVVRNQANQIYRSNPYRLAAANVGVVSNTGEQGNVFYITPKYRRSNNNNSNSGSSSSNSNANTNDSAAGSDSNGK